VLWEGGASSRGAIIRALHLFLLIGFVAAWFVAIAMLPRGQTRQRNQACDSAAPAAETVTKEVDHSGRNRALAVIGGVVALLTAAAYADSLARMRNAWYVITTERICIQGGGVGRYLAVLDLDKVVSVQAVASPLQRMWGLQSIYFSQAGATVFVRNDSRTVSYNPYVVAFIPSDSDLLSRLLNEWLPRDNRRAT